MSGNYIGSGPAPGGMILVGDTNPIGMVNWFHGVPDGSWLQLNGQIVAKATYPDLWVWAQGFLTADQTVNPGLYRSVDANTFALPNLQGLFLRSVGQVDAQHVAAALGVKQIDGSGPLNLKGILSTATGGGAVALWRGNDGDPVAMATALNGTEVKPVNVALVPCVKALKTVLVPASAFPNQGINTLPRVATTSGTFVDFLNIPAGVKRIVAMLAGVSTNGNSNLIAQIGDSTGVKNTGYLGSVCQPGNAVATAGANFTTGFGLTGAMATVLFLHGTITLTLQDAATNTWIAATNLGQSNGPATHAGGGEKSLPATLDRVRITTVNGTDLFDAGSVGVQYQS